MTMDTNKLRTNYEEDLVKEYMSILSKGNLTDVIGNIQNRLKIKLDNFVNSKILPEYALLQEKAYEKTKEKIHHEVLEK